MTEINFNPAVVRSYLDTYLGAHAHIEQSADGNSIWVFPTAEGSPIFLRFEEGACVVSAGFTFRQTLQPASVRDEWIIIDCIEAVVTGAAVEFFDFTSKHLPDLRSEGVAGSAFQGRLVSIEAGQSKARHAYAIPAWGAPTERPTDSLGPA